MNKIIIPVISFATLFFVSCGGSESKTGGETAVTSAATASADANTFQVDANTSTFEWKAAKVTAEHHGTIKVIGGELMAEQGKPVAGKFEIDMNSIVNNDLTEPEWNGKLVGHLKSEDFFSAEKHPKGVFEITGVEPIDGAAEGQPNYLIKGNLTLKGITKPVEFKSVVKSDGNALTASGEVELDRTQWDIRYGSGKFFQGLGDKMIYDNFTVKFNLVAKA